MDAGIDLNSASRQVLIAVIVRQQAIIERLEKRIAQLEGQAKPPGSRRMPGLKPKAGRKPAQPKGPRKSRPQGFARTRMTPTQRVEHVMEHCPDCGTQLSGGWTQRTREVIDVPVVEAEVTEHVYMARTCPGCRRRCIPPAQLDGVVMGRQRLGVNPESSSGQALISLIAMLREDARLPIGTIQRYLRTVHELPSAGEPSWMRCGASHRPKGQGVVAGILERIRGSPVVHADETGWREGGHNGYVWTFSAPTQRYFLRRNRSQAIVDEALGDAFSGVLVSDCYAAYHHYDGPKQRCWVHPCSSQGQALCGTATTLCTLYPDDAPLARWADAVHRLYTRAKAFTHPQARRRRTAQLALERQLLAVCRPYLTDNLRHSPASADASSATSRACPALDTGTLRLRGRTRSPGGQQRRLPDSAPGAPKASTLSPPADNCSLPLNPELLRARPTPCVLNGKMVCRG